MWDSMSLVQKTKIEGMRASFTFTDFGINVLSKRVFIINVINDLELFYLLHALEIKCSTWVQFISFSLYNYCLFAHLNI